MKRSTSLNLLLILVIVVFLGAIGCALLPTPEAEVEIEFWASEEIISPGGCTVLHWQVQGAEGYSVYLDGAAIPAVGEDMVCLDETRSFSLIVVAEGRSHGQSVTVYVSGTPGAEPIASPAGPLLETPIITATETSALPTATQAPPTATSAPPTATPAPPTPDPAAPRIIYFRANGTEGSITVSPGTMVTLSWEWEQVTAGYLDPGNVALPCPAMPCTFKAAPPATTTYTLRALNDTGVVTKTVTIKIS